MRTWSKRISLWAERTFGQSTPASSYSRFMQEWEEFVEACQSMNKEKQAEEAADMVIALSKFVDSIGYDLAAVMFRKEYVNSQRNWTSHGDGTGQHIRNPELDKRCRDRFDAFRATNFEWYRRACEVPFYVKEPENEVIFTKDLG
jgi:NTP pyrophosphatase (non-canonical NTP hydrolase)